MNMELSNTGTWLQTPTQGEVRGSNLEGQDHNLICHWVYVVNPCVVSLQQE